MDRDRARERDGVRPEQGRGRQLLRSWTVTIEENKRLVRRVFDEVYNEGRYDAGDELTADAYVSHNKLAIEVLGPDGIKHAARLQRDAFPDLHSVIEDLVAEGDRVAVRGRDTGTHSGAPFKGVAASGRPVRDHLDRHLPRRGRATRGGVARNGSG